MNTAKFSPVPARAGYATVYIGRPYTRDTSMFSLPIEVDGRQIVSLAPNHYTAVELAPGPHSVSVPNEMWNKAIFGIPHPAEFSVEAGKAYYLLPIKRYEDAGYRFFSVGTTIAPVRTADPHSSFSVQVVAANAAPPAEFESLALVQPQ